MTTQLPQNPFPGMNPYLERSELWHGVHTRVIVELGNTLARQLRPEYMVRVEERMYVSAETDDEVRLQTRLPDVMILDDGAGAATSVAVAPRSEDAISVRIPYQDEQRQRYLEVIRVSNREVVAVIELLSPSNKTNPGRQAYKAKRNQVFHSTSHLVEIDLLRVGEPMPVIGNVPPSHYRILVTNAHNTDAIADLYPCSIQTPIPVFVMPLAEGSEGIAIDLKPIIDEVYVLGSYDRDIDYDQDPTPPLPDADRAWIDQLLRSQGLRNRAV